MSKGQRISVSTAKLNQLLKIADTYLIKAENGEWVVPKGTYQAIKKASDHVKTEIFKQSRQKRKTMNIEYVADEEQREYQKSMMEQEIENQKMQG